MIVLALLACMPEEDVLAHYDRDGDGFLHAEAAAQGVEGPFDCDDTDDGIHPDAAEVCDGIDNNCDSAVDDGEAAPKTFFVDADADGFGTDSTAQGCEIAAGQSTVSGDCDDSSSAVFPGAEELWYDGVDQDCLGGDDYDADADGQRSDEHGGADCDDEDAAVYDGAPEGWQDAGTDNDCDGSVQDQIVLDPGSATIIEGNSESAEFGATIIEVPAGWLADEAVVLITAPASESFLGAAYAWPATELASQSSAADAPWVWAGQDATNANGDLLGYSAAWAGDVVDPVLLLAAPGTSTGRGTVYGWVGGSIGEGADAPTFRVIGDAERTYSAGVLVSGTDLDGDGQADLIVQSILDGRVASNAGSAAIFYDSSAISGDISYADADALLTTSEPGALMMPFAIGDADDDGVDDLGFQFQGMAFPEAEGAVLTDVPTSGQTDVPSAALATTYSCSPRAVVDLDGDGTAELLAVGGAVIQFDLPGAGALVPWESAAAMSEFEDAVNNWATGVQPSVPYWAGRRRVLAASWVYEEETGAVAVDTIGWGTSTSYSDAMFLILGENPGDRFGLSSAVVDADGDGVQDIVLGAPGYDGDVSGSGAVYVIPGPR